MTEDNGKFVLTNSQKQWIAVITQFVVAILAVYNWVGVNCPQFNLPAIVIGTETLTSIITAVVVLVVVIYNTWKNRNCSQASWLAQLVLDALKSGLLAPEAVEEMLDEAEYEMNGTLEDLNAEIEQEVEEFMEKQDEINSNGE